MKHIDINADTGESFGRWRIVDDNEVLSYVSSANIACGMHAGDPVVMDATARACAERGVAIGAHPGFPDLQGFGRRNMAMTPKEIEVFVAYQIGALKALAGSLGQRVVHVKPHGALYNMAAFDMDIAMAVARGVARASYLGHDLILVGLAGSLSLDAADKVGLPKAREGFCDRAYHRDGSLVSRSESGSVLDDPKTVAARAVAMVQHQSVLSIEGVPVDIQVDTICIHSDTTGAVEIAKAVRRALDNAKITVGSLRAMAS
ncbi:MAG: LamB/YcsF family protein [Bacillota bacterium]|jgi:UPF0271 protein